MGMLLNYLNIVLDAYLVGSNIIEAYCLKRGMRGGYAKWVPPIMAALWALVLVLNMSNIIVGNTDRAIILAVLAIINVVTRIWTTDIYCYQFLRTYRNQNPRQ